MHYISLCKAPTDHTKPRHTKQSPHIILYQDTYIYIYIKMYHMTRYVACCYIACSLWPLAFRHLIAESGVVNQKTLLIRMSYQSTCCRLSYQKPRVPTRPWLQLGGSCSPTSQLTKYQNHWVVVGRSWAARSLGVVAPVEQAPGRWAESSVQCPHRGPGDQIWQQ